MQFNKVNGIKERAKMNILSYKAIITLMLLIFNAPIAHGSSTASQSYSWISSTLDALSTIFSTCIEAPSVDSSYTTGTVSLDASNPVWIPSNIQVESGKAISFNWNGSNLYKAPQKFFMMYRLDPRFSRPQLFILKFDYTQNKYVSDFHTYQVKSGTNCSCNCPGNGAVCTDASTAASTTPLCPSTCIMSSSNTAPAMTIADCQNNLGNSTYFSQCVSAYSSYFNMVSRPPITVNQGDIVSVSLVSANTFFGAGSNFQSELTYSDKLSNIASIYTTTGLADNQVIYASGSAICNSLFASATPPSGSSYVCSQSGGAYAYANSTSYPSLFLGLLDSTDISTSVATPPLTPVAGIPATLYQCPLSQSQSYGVAGSSIYKQATSACYYGGGQGIKVSLGGSVINASYVGFVKSPFSGRYVFYFQSPSTGNLDFSTDWMLANNSGSPSMFTTISDPTKWLNGTTYSSSAALQSYITSLESQSASSGSGVFSGGLANFVHLGRYIMQVEIGGGSALTSNNMNGVDVVYTITSTNTTPSPTLTGTSVPQSTAGVNAGSSGYLWMKVVNPTPNMIAGNINVGYMNYTGSTLLSNIVNNYLVIPVVSALTGVSPSVYTGGIADNRGYTGQVSGGAIQQLYIGLTVQNTTLKNIAMTCLTLYVILYGFYFLLGATQVTTMDLVTRYIKITIIVALFSTNSWQIFNDNFFSMFIGGTSYMVNNVIGFTGNSGNIFGFLDIIFLKYLEPNLWFLLFIQFLQLPSGLTFFALLVVAGIWIYLRAVLEVVIGFLMAFLSMAVLLSIAPIFITMMLFSRTKHLFDNWISALLNCMFQPTILLIFFLLIDQLMTQQLHGAVVRACWDWLIDISLTISFPSAVSLPSIGPISIPFLPGIPFFVPQVGNGDLANGVSDAYLSIVSSSVLFYCYAVMSRGLVGYVSSVVGMLTGIGAIEGIAGQQAAASITADIQGRPDAHGNLQGGLRSYITGDVNAQTGKREDGVVGGALNVARTIKEKTMDQKYSTKTEGELKGERTKSPDKGDSNLRAKIAKRNNNDFKPKGK